MGYYTTYKMEVKYRDPLTGEISRCNKNVEKKIRKEEIPNYDNPYDEIFENNMSAVKWYDHETDVRNLSAKYPDVLFVLEGEGEGSGDVWKKYFLNGKIQRAPGEITFPDFDFNKLH